MNLYNFKNLISSIIILHLNFFVYYFNFCYAESVATRGISLLAVSRGYYSLWWMGFSLQRLLQSFVVEHRLQGAQSSGVVACGLSSFRAWALECRLHCVCYLPRAGIETMSPESADAFLTTGPPGEFQHFIFWMHNLHQCLKCISQIFLSGGGRWGRHRDFSYTPCSHTPQLPHYQHPLPE